MLNAPIYLRPSYATYLATTYTVPWCPSSFDPVHVPTCRHRPVATSTFRCQARSDGQVMQRTWKKSGPGSGWGECFVKEGGIVLPRFNSRTLRASVLLYPARFPMPSSSHCKGSNRKSRAHRVGGVFKGCIRISPQVSRGVRVVWDGVVCMMRAFGME